MENRAGDSNASVPVSLRAGICDSGLVSVRVEIVVGVGDSRRAPAGHWVTDGWRPAPPQTGETLELIRDLRQEALRTAEEEDNKVRHTLHSTKVDASSYSFCNPPYCRHYNMGMQMIPESHLASIGEVVSLHDGVLRD